MTVVVQALLTKAEESDSGEDKLLIQNNLRNKPKKTEGKKKRRKESGCGGAGVCVSVAARGTGGGSLQDLAASGPPASKSRAGRRTKHSHGEASNEDGGGVAGRTREGQRS